MSFTISNYCPININFMIYIYNAYANHYSRYTDKPKFPFFPKINSGFLSFEEFESRFISSWDEIIKSYEEEPSLLKWDIKILNDKQEGIYESLFDIDEEGIQLFHAIWESFLAWWPIQPYGGQFILERMTNEIIPVIFHRLKQRLEETKKLSSSGNFMIQVVYEQIPSICKDYGTFFILEPVRNLITDSKLADVTEKMLFKVTM